MSQTPQSLDQLKRILEGAVDVISAAELRTMLDESLAKKRPLRIKYGADPSSPDLHLGHTVALRKLRQFQDLGHTVVFIIGDFTALIGDPSHRSQTRKMLTPEEVKQNALTYQEQVFKILDKNRTEVRYNSEWLGRMTAADFLHLTAQYTVARILERDDFKKRFESQVPIAVVEFMYPLLQGYDSVQVKSDVELGGTDQKFNLLVGRELQKTWNQRPQAVITLPLLEGLDGIQKMSKSYGNHIALQDSPREMFGKSMSIPDALVGKYFQLTSGMTAAEYQPILDTTFKTNPREGKTILAAQIVSLYYGRAEADKARAEFDRIFRDKGLPDEITEIPLPYKEMDIVTILKDAGLVTSKGEGRRLIEQGGVRIEQQKVSDPDLKVSLTSPVLIQCGKRKFARVRHGA